MGAEITEAFVRDMSLGHERFPVTLDPRPMEVVRQEIIEWSGGKRDSDDHHTNSEGADSSCDLPSEGCSTPPLPAEVDNDLPAEVIEAPTRPDTASDLAPVTVTATPVVAAADTASVTAAAPGTDVDVGVAVTSTPETQALALSTTVMDSEPADSVSEEEARSAVADQIVCTPVPSEENASERSSTRSYSRHRQGPDCNSGMEPPLEDERSHEFPAERPIPRFIYTRDCVAPDYLDADPNDYDPKVEKPCGCVGDCLRNLRCPCVFKNGERSPYKHGLLDFERTLVHECGKHCGCSDFCSLRKSQQGLNVPVVVCWTGKRGWGVLAKSRIDRGHFICCYTGEVISPEVFGNVILSWWFA